MRYTNKYNLPKSLEQAIRPNKYKRVGNISITRLIRPVQMCFLEQEHYDEIETDVSEEVYRLLGDSVHYMLSHADNSLTEEQLIMPVNGWMVSGKPDLLESDGTLSDYKVTSAWSFILGDKPEWEAQLNLYKLLYEAYGFDVKRLQIVGILRDWIWRKAGEKNYPPAPCQVKEIPIWDRDKAVTYMRDRVELHQAMRETGYYLECTAEERWHKPDTWAVKKKGLKRATRVFASETDAELYAADHDNLIVEHRIGEDIRCEQFCPVSEWCKQYEQIKKDR